MMEIYYEDASSIILLGDARDVLTERITADVVITDPPYGVGLTTKTSDYRDSKNFDAGESLRASVLYPDDEADVRALIANVMPRLERVTPRMLIFSGARMMWAYPEPAAVGCVFTMAGAGSSAWGFQCMHPVLFYGKDPYTQDGKGRRPNSLKNDQPNREHFDHPCPKPLAWMRWAVERASRPGETILDPFMGTGTTLRAAKDMGRKAVGIEIEERYCEIAARRLSQEVLTLT